MTELKMDIALCESLAHEGSGGDSHACRQLVEHLWPFCLRMVRSSRSMGPLAHSEDHVHNVVTRVVGKLGRSDGGGLRHYPSWRATHPEKDFSDWLRIVTTNLVRDYVREQLGWRHSTTLEPSRKRLLNEFTLSLELDDVGVRPPMTAAQTARELLEYAGSRLTPDQIRALDLWLQGASFDQIDAELSMRPGRGRKALRAAVAMLRRHFTGSEMEQEPK